MTTGFPLTCLIHFFFVKLWLSSQKHLWLCSCNIKTFVFKNTRLNYFFFCIHFVPTTPSIEICAAWTIESSSSSSCFGNFFSALQTHPRHSNKLTFRWVMTRQRLWHVTVCKKTSPLLCPKAHSGNGDLGNTRKTRVGEAWSEAPSRRRMKTDGVWRLESSFPARPRHRKHGSIDI